MSGRFLLGTAVVWAIPPVTPSGTVQLHVPKEPPVGTNTLSDSFQGYSMEFASYPDIAGNLSHPNALTNRMLQNLKDITKSSAPIRIGGTTSNHAFWVPDQNQAIIQNFAVPGADQPANVTWGPAYLESFKVFPNGTKYTVGLTFDSGDVGRNKTVEEAKVFYDGMGEDLFAFEIGNEFDGFPVDRNTTTWSLQEYVKEWLDRTDAIAKHVLQHTTSKLFQAGVFAGAGIPPFNASLWTPKRAIDLGISSTGKAKTFCTHQYFGVACQPPIPTLGGNLMNRTHLAEIMQYHATESAYSASKGLPYVLGETNSIACQGLAGVSDVFGAAIWSVDYALYAASLNVSNIYWQMGIGYRYAPWQAIQNGTTAPGPRPLYYGNLFVATALGDSDAQVVPIVNTTSLAGYAIYSGKTHQSKLRSIALVNMDVFNSSSSAATKRSSAKFSLPQGLCGENAKIRVKQLTAPGAEVREGITFDAQTVALNGSIISGGKQAWLKGNTVEVMASEAVLLQFE